MLCSPNRSGLPTVQHRFTSCPSDGMWIFHSSLLQSQIQEINCIKEMLSLASPLRQGYQYFWVSSASSRAKHVSAVKTDTNTFLTHAYMQPTTQIWWHLQAETAPVASDCFPLWGFLVNVWQQEIHAYIKIPVVAGLRQFGPSSSCPGCPVSGIWAYVYKPQDLQPHTNHPHTH